MRTCPRCGAEVPDRDPGGPACGRRSMPWRRIVLAVLVSIVFVIRNAQATCNTSLVGSPPPPYRIPLPAGMFLMWCLAAWLVLYPPRTR